jgi:Spy/CpxP family protein refolding chaperone
MSKFLLGVALAGAFVAGVFVSDGLRSHAADEPKVRGTLYPKWGQIGLTGEQVQQVYKIQAKYKPEVEKLGEQIRDLKRKEKAEAEKVLTPAQKQRLRELLLGEEKPSDKAPPKDKPSDKKDG